MVATIIPLSIYTTIAAGVAAYLHAAKSLDSTTIYIATAVYLVGAWFLWPSDKEWRVAGTAALYKNKEVINHKIDSTYEEYESNFGKDSRNTDAATHTKLFDKRKENYASMVRQFYDLVTDFYEYGWGQSFHFGPRMIGEGFQESLKRCEYYLALRLGMTHHHHVVDLGCGVGGPQRNIAHFTGAKVTGINVNEYQIKVGTKYCAQQGLAEKCDYIKADFMNIPVKDNTYDHAYAIEATCHAPDKVACFSEAFRIVKPGGMFACLEWCVTPKYDAKNARHVAIKQGIEVGNGVPALLTFDEILDGARKAGWEIVDAFDLERTVHSKYELPWYDSLVGKYTTLTGFRMSYIGRNVTHAFVTILELLRIAPKGSTKVSALLNATALDLVEGGQKEIFTPSYFFLARKPLNATGKAK